MPSVRATFRASSADSIEQQLPKRLAGSSASRHGQTRSVTPTTSYPCSTSSAAATEESTPPLMPTTIRSMAIDLTATSSGAAGAEELRDALELVGRGVDDLDLPSALVAADHDARHQGALERLLERGHLRGVPAATSRRAPWRCRALGRADRILGRADGPVVSQDLVAELQLLGRRRQREQGACVTHRETPAAQVGLDLVRQPEQPQGVRDGGPVAPDPLRELLLGPAELGQEVPVGLGFLHGDQVFAEQVLDQRQLEALGIGRFPHDRGDPLESGLTCRPPATLSGNELITAGEP